ncbi:unnamed protein product [Orchesella dallaii]|uniref:Secreted protein n=1 Tax=Orchesella dallaii TaxID=48710 RepID=A0ABP1PVT6_9HEXA
MKRKGRVTKFLLILTTLVNLGDDVYSNVPAKDTIANHRHGRSENKIEKLKQHKSLTMLLSSIESNPDLNPLIRNDRTGSPNTRDRGQEKNLFFTWMPTEVKVCLGDNNFPVLIGCNDDSKPMSGRWTCVVVVSSSSSASTNFQSNMQPKCISWPKTCNKKNEKQKKEDFCVAQAPCKKQMLRAQQLTN